VIINRVKTSRILKLDRIIVLSMAIAIVFVSVGVGAQQTKNIPAGEKAKIKGRITQRDAETFTVDSSTGQATVVLLTDATSVRSKKKGLGIFRRGEEYAVTSLLRGLVVEIEGVGNEKGQLVAEKVRFNESDLKTANTVDSRVAPVEEATKKISGQVDEVGAVAKDAKSDAARANEGVAAANKRIDVTNERVDATNARISGLDNFDQKRQTTVYFAVNSYVISPEARKELDALAQEALGSTGYLIEVAGFADPTGDAEKNLILSQRRADAVVKYLAINGNVPMRRIVTPMGYGSTRSAADHNNPEGRKLERRVDVRLLISRGQNQS
jgi:outer membrane protein OmpA-like peptidoglycan-associated protein